LAPNAGAVKAPVERQGRTFASRRGNAVSAASTAIAIRWFENCQRNGAAEEGWAGCHG
jgi:hypothetical protein